MDRDVDLMRLEGRLMEQMRKAEMPVLQARYDFELRSMTVQDQRLFLRAGSELVRAIIGMGMAKGRLDPAALDDEMVGGIFVSKTEAAYSRYGGIRGALSVSRSGDEGGLQGVFTRVAEAIAQELSRQNIAYIFQEEVDESDEEQVRAIARQLRYREGLEGIALFDIMKSWKELVLYRVQRRRAMQLRFGQAAESG